MKWIAKFLVASVLVLLAGCVTSLHPLYTDKDLIFDPALLGTWTGEKKSKWVFGNHDDKKAYKAVYTDEMGKRGEFVAHLVKIKGTVFLDLYPAEPKFSQNDYYNMHLLGVHSFLLVTQIGPSLKTRSLNDSWLNDFLKKNPEAIAHEVIDNNEIVLTASTRQLQKFLLKHVKTKDAFAEESVWKRK